MEKILKFIKEQRKILCATAMALITVVISVIAFVVFNSNNLKFIDDEITLYVTREGSRETYCVYGTDGKAYKQLEMTSKDKATLHIMNGRDDVESVYVVVVDDNGDAVSKKQFLSTDKQWKIELELEEAGIYDVYFTVIKEDSMEFYVSSEESFLEVISDYRVEKQSVYMMTDIVIEEYTEESIEILYPFIWKSEGYDFSTDKKLIFKGQQTGNMSIDNSGSTFESGLITCDTPAWEYDIEKLFGEFNEEHYYYIRALRVNDRSVDTTSLYVDSEEKLDGIVEYYEDETGVKSGSIVVPNGVTTITVAGDYELGQIKVEDSLTIEMVGNSDVIFDGVNVELIWNGDTAPTMEAIERYMNVKSYNGEATDEFIGGEGTCQFVSGSLKLTSSRTNTMVVDGNYIDVYTGYADRIVPSEAAFEYELSGTGKAIVVKKGENYYCIVTDQDNKTRGYKINMVQKSYSLPVIYIETENGEAITSKETTIPGTFTIDYNGTATYEGLADIPMDIRGRGNSSWKLKKKPYKIKFDKKMSLFGLTEAKEWVLQANHADKSLIRNKLAMDMGNVLDNVIFTPHAYNVDVFVNGEYMGVYTIVEQIEVKDGRIEGEKDSSHIDTDYLLEIGGDEDKTSFGTNIFSTSLCRWVEIKNPDSDVLTEAQYNYVKEYCQTVDNAVMALEGYEEYLDIPSLIDWFLLNEFSYNLDGSFRRSDFLVKKKGGKLYMATYWDYDYAFGNFWRDSAAFDEWICLGNENTKDDDYIWSNWMTYLLTDKNFTDQLKARWQDVGQELYNTAMATIDEAENNVTASAEENFIRWPGVLGYKTQYEFWKTRNISTYEGQLQYLRDFIEKRYKWMDKTIKAM